MIVLYTGCQWKMIPIAKDEEGKSEIHYSQIFRVYKQWVKYGSTIKIFENSVLMCHEHGLLDTSIIHGDGSTTMAKKGGDVLEFSGHKHMKGEKVVAPDFDTIQLKKQGGRQKNISLLYQKSRFVVPSKYRI
jgi:hypothetical protein